MLKFEALATEPTGPRRSEVAGSNHGSAASGRVIETAADLSARFLLHRLTSA
jgi:hypothetical protein